MDSSKTTGANKQRNNVPHEAFDDRTSSVKKAAAVVSSSKERTLPLALAPPKKSTLTSAGETLPSAKETANWSRRKKSSIGLGDRTTHNDWPQRTKSGKLSRRPEQRQQARHEVEREEPNRNASQKRREKFMDEVKRRAEERKAKQNKAHSAASSSLSVARAENSMEVDSSCSEEEENLMPAARPVVEKHSAVSRNASVAWARKSSIALGDPVNKIAGDGAVPTSISMTALSSPAKANNAAHKSIGRRSWGNTKTVVPNRVSLSPNAKQPTPSSGTQAEEIVEAAVEQHLRSMNIDFTMMTCTSRSSSTTDKYLIHIDVVATDDVKYNKMTPIERLRLVTDPLRGFEFIEGLTGRFMTEGKIKKTNEQLVKVLEAAEKEIKHMEEHTLGSSGSKSKTNPLQLLNENVEGNAEEKTLEFNADTAVGPKKEITPKDFPSKSEHLAGQTIHLSGQFQSFDSGVEKDPLANPIKTAREIGKDGLTNVISNQCGKCVGNLGEGVDFLVVGRAPSGGKSDKAKVLGIRIITVSDLHRVATKKTTLEELKRQPDADVDGFAKTLKKRKRKQAAAVPTSFKQKKRG